MKTQIEQTIQLIKKSQNILCITQKYSTSDGIASSLAMQVLVNRLNKKITVVIPSKELSKLSFLPGYNLVNSDIPNSNDTIIKINSQNIKKINSIKGPNFTEIIISSKNKQISTKDISITPKLADFDLILALDMPNLESLGNIFEEQAQLFSEVPIVSISSDPAYDLFGRISISQPQKSSTSEIIFDLINTDPDFKKYLNKTISTILLTGIIASTGSFLGKNTTPSSLEAASILQKNGAIQSDIIENLFKKKSLPTLKIWGRILNNIQIDEVHRISWSNATINDFNQTESSLQNIDDISDNLLRFVKNTDLSALIFEEIDKTHIQLRTSNPSINLQDLQKNFGGKIIKNGLNITVKGKTIEEIESNLLEALVSFQNKRLNIDPPLKLQKKELDISPKETTHLDLHIKNKKHSQQAKAPKEIPFSAPAQPNEKTGKIKKTNNKEINSIKYNPKKSGIPDWLK